ncbi:hypothetical protein C4K05_1490 [Pseudomonas chlororaphis subsp. aureofaciens]|uniref:Uncharacterized protein n=1 Tax=Pseudomonas chlororaphis subsp. aureofaciens TaxID=587851 RepID=A0AAD1E509_9PSED|nr:hypothetical protein C4K08_1467 [Pseudomonas chlororaphis subsp. aureofaciens]AZE28266.1 hypothetical protein C4K07_1466 [Pseudomonas chlororaphis subsp. aureofaciens]AZE34513.1 hypothetical protein C4K06_1465 [Pseudomonas chlororaphis subsp. aureofaciens]AZE40845.1 hypothetical protein C4K05_1490 [Pseudomonas chlororaphis subsp. aureofaciens]
MADFGLFRCAVNQLFSVLPLQSKPLVGLQKTDFFFDATCNKTTRAVPQIDECIG